VRMATVRDCKICRSAYRKEIDSLVKTNIPLKEIAQKYHKYFNCTFIALYRSVQTHKNKKHPPTIEDILPKTIKEELEDDNTSTSELETIALGMARRKERKERKFKKDEDILDPLMADLMSGFAKGDLGKLSTKVRGKDGYINFAEEILGLPVSKHEGQVVWLESSTKRINLLHPGNKFGKSLIGGVKHLYHHFTKIALKGIYHNTVDWKKLQYDTLNFGPGYEQAREILRMARDIAQGNIRIPVAYQKKYGVTNKSMLKDWFIVKDHAEAYQLPYIEFISGGRLLGRSYDEMGAAFKMKGVAYISGDEVADISELWTFTNGTLLPRGVAFPNFSIDYYGTPQPDGHDYMRMIEMAEEEMKRPDWKDNGMFYVQRGSMYQNPFLDADTVAAVERIADPILKRQIIDGEYVETGDKYFGHERIQNAVDEQLQLIARGFPGRKYLVIGDFAGGESYWADFTVIGVLDYTEEPYRLVGFRRFKGGEIPIPAQYKLVEDTVYAFLGKDDTTFKYKPSLVKLLIDSSALGGKNALAFLRHLSPIQFDATPAMKAEMLSTLKMAFDGGESEDFRRKTRTRADGIVEDLNPNWGIIRIPNVPEIIAELQNYKLDDKKIKTDIVMMLGMGIHYLEMRRPKQPKNRMMNFDLLQII